MTDRTPAGTQEPAAAPPLKGHEAQRNWQQFLDEEIHKAAGGTIQAAAGYGAKVVIDKIRDRQPHDQEPPAHDPAAADTYS